MVCGVHSLVHGPTRRGSANNPKHGQHLVFERRQTALLHTLAYHYPTAQCTNLELIQNMALDYRNALV